MTEPSPPLLIRGARLLDGAAVDVRIDQGRIAGIDAALAAAPTDAVVEARGGLLLPGLIDHHLHLFATAAARESVVCGPPAVRDAGELRAALRAADQARAAAGPQWLRGIGFHDSVCPDLDRDWLDAVVSARPVRIQHRSGMLWVLNSAALRELGVAAGQTLPSGVEQRADGSLSGRFYNLDAWLGARLPRTAPSLAGLSAELARHGITAVTDTGARNDQAAWQALVAAQRRGELQQRLLVMGDETLHDLAVREEGRPTSDWHAIGPLKLYLREQSLPELETLTARMRAAHAAGRAVAVHCVTRVELLFALAALREAGARPGDRIEHAAIADDEAVAQLAALGVTVVTQPHFIAERGEQYRRDVDAEDQPWLYRGAGFLRGGVRLAAGSDAPYGSIDPWAALRAAVARRDGSGQVMAAAERLTPAAALALFGGSPDRPGGALRTLAPGQPADLCLLDDFQAVRAGDFATERVVLTLCAGRPLYQRRGGMTP